MFSDLKVSMASNKHENSITVSKEEDFSSWYQQVTTKCGLISNYDVSGCYVLLPGSYGIWELVQRYLNDRFIECDVQNVYFPLLITENNLNKEQESIESFKPEVAWVTHTGDSELNERLAIRPTSECAMYSTYAKLIRSHADLPLKYNQWCNVLRWEFKDATPFIRSREFLWNEGHSCFADLDSAKEEVQTMINIYQETYQDILAVPVISGIKTDKERFGGALKTLTVEGFIPSVGKAVQAATSHCLGQNFSKMFDIKYQAPDGTTNYVYQNSWGFTTRSLGVMIMTHGDNKGLIIPPKVAPIQVIIIPLIFRGKEKMVNDYTTELTKTLKASNIRFKVDNSGHNPGWKYNKWEMLGVPLRIEIGPRDSQNNTIVLARRDTGAKETITDDFVNRVIKTLEEIQHDMFTKASTELFNSISRPQSLEEFVVAVENKCMSLIPFCCDTKCENNIKNLTGAKSLCIPRDSRLDTAINDNDTCVGCGSHAVDYCLFGKSY